MTAKILEILCYILPSSQNSFVFLISLLVYNNILIKEQKIEQEMIHCHLNQY